jgi:hypothetical protein
MKSLITHGLILLSIILGFIFKFTIASLIVLVVEIIFLCIMEFADDDCTFLRFFYLKKIYTEWGVFYTGVFGRYIYIYKDVLLFFLYVAKIDTKYSQIDNPDKLKDEIIRELKSSSYLKERFESIEEEKKRKEMKKILNNWSGFTNKQLERDYKISKLL